MGARTERKQHHHRFAPAAIADEEMRRSLNPAGGTHANPGNSYEVEKEHRPIDPCHKFDDFKVGRSKCEFSGQEPGEIRMQKFDRRAPNAACPAFQAHSVVEYEI
jgi:hypothetical protein